MLNKSRCYAAYVKAVAIVRAVFMHPDGFSYGFEDHDGFCPFETSVRHRLTQLGFKSDEIEFALDAALDVLTEQYGDKKSPCLDWWGHA